MSAHWKTAVTGFLSGLLLGILMVGLAHVAQARDADGLDGFRFRKLVHTYTAASADSAPSTTSPRFDTDNIIACPNGPFSLGFYHTGSSDRTLTITPWVYDGFSAKWYKYTSVSGIGEQEYWPESPDGYGYIYLQVTAFGGTTTINSSNPILLYGGCN